MTIVRTNGRLSSLFLLGQLSCKNRRQVVRGLGTPVPTERIWGLNTHKIVQSYSIYPSIYNIAH